MRAETDLFMDVKEAYAAAKKEGRVNPHLRIMEASRCGRGVRLSLEEVDELALHDDTIRRAALGGYE